MSNAAAFFGADEPRTTTRLGDFLRARIDDDMRAIQADDPAHLLAILGTMRHIVSMHDAWPVLVETEPVMESMPNDFDPHVMAFRMTKRIEWLTQREYVRRFGTEPPHAPMLMAMAQVYADHPDFRDEWRM